MPYQRSMSPKDEYQKGMCQIKRKRVKQGVQRHLPERKKMGTKSIPWEDSPHFSEDRKERILHKSLKI